MRTIFLIVDIQNRVTNINRFIVYTILYEEEALRIAEEIV